MVLLRTFHFAFRRQVKDAQLRRSQTVRHHACTDVGDAIAVYNEASLQEIHGEYNVEVENNKFTASAVKGAWPKVGAGESQTVSGRAWKIMCNSGHCNTPCLRIWR